jgi:acetolactate decarboxylase
MAVGMAALSKAQIPFLLEQREATLVGFWSREHQGIFTPSGSNMHIHFQTPDNQVSGHVEALSILADRMTLALPERL